MAREKLELEVVAYQAGDSQYDYVAHRPIRTSVVRQPGKSLAEWRTQLGGDEGEVTGPHGEPYYLSLKPWADADPIKTRLILRFKSAPRIMDPAELERLRERIKRGEIADVFEQARRLQK